MSTPPTSAAGAASMMRLPPSPETTSILLPPGALPKHLSIHEHDAADTASHSSRLRSIARYGSFHPQAIACSTPLIAHYSAEQSAEREAQSETVGKKDSTQQQQRVGTSVAAIAGPQGVALFRVSRPHTPLVVLSHASSRKSSAGTVSALSFQPNTKDSLLLAAARGNGILVWDASGHSLSPFLGRLAMESTLSLADRITSISWKSSAAQPMLATTNATNACLWDLRTALRANSSRPSVRLDTRRKINNDGSVIDPLVQIAASSKNEVATLDAAGTVHIFDVRISDGSPGNIGEVSSFSAFHHVGIGLESLSASSEDTRWVTWGLDAPQTDAIVKVWSDGAARKGSDIDSYSYMDGSSTASPKTSISKSETSNQSVQMQYRQVAEFSTPFLACARVCPEPFEDRVVTVGMIPGRGGVGAAGWEAETWKLKDLTENSSVEGDHYGVEKIASFGVLDDSETASMVGTNTTLGSLRGAELALEPSLGMNRFVLDDDKDGIKEEGVDLLLCCLSEKGYVTTHTVFEAPSRGLDDQKGEGISESQDSPRHSRSQAERPFAYSDRTRVFPGDGNQGRDAATMLRVTGGSDHIDRVVPNEEQEGTSTSLQKTDLQYFAAGNAGAVDAPHPDDRTSTQFDMDVPVAYGANVPGQGVNDVAEAASSPVVLLSNADDEIEIGLQRGSISGRIDKEKVPCPRLCGATFSPGGIVCFNNGEVRKMWSWYEQSDPSRRVLSSEGKCRPASQQRSNTAESIAKGGRSEQGDSSVFSMKPEEMTSRRKQECPRTLQDLESMTDHARFSQWRSDESSGDESSIDDQSDESLDGFASGDEEGARQRMYEKYFDVSEEKGLSSPLRRDGEKGRSEDSISPPRSPARQKQAPVSAKSNEAAGGGAFVGPSSDLVPTVFITHDHDALVFSGQSEELARSWKLGAEGQTTDDDEEVEAKIPRRLTERESTDSNSGDSFGWGWNEGAVGANRVYAALPRLHSGKRVRSIAEEQVPLGKELQMSPSQGDEQMQRVRSDPMLLQLVPSSQQIKNKYGVGSDDDPVHAGAYSKRPNRNESLVFLKKIVTHQRSDRQLPSLMSPPDSPLLPNKMPFAGPKRRSSSAGGIAQTPSPTSIVVDESELLDPNLNVIPFGVYTLGEERGPPRRAKLCEEKLRDTCLHNAEMAENLLHDEHDNFNGWGGPYGGSLGHDLVSSFLRFYEAQGDAQMLATMVCVLGGGQWKKIAEGRSLLPVSHQDRYDSYIRRYADVLYGWRLMTIRAEVNKHLVQRLPEPSGDDQYSAVYMVVWCSRCHQEATTDDGICRNCRNFAFRCSLCDIAVRGLFTVCASCGHGGHTSHLTEWFHKHSVCPTGCGCECVSVSKQTMQTGDALVPSSAPVQPLLDEVLHETPELLIGGAAVQIAL